MALWIMLYLVGGFNPFKRYSSNWIMFPNRGEHENIWNHQLVIFLLFPCLVPTFCPFFFGPPRSFSHWSNFKESPDIPCRPMPFRAVKNHQSAPPQKKAATPKQIWDTVDGRHPAPVDIENIGFFTGFHIQRLVREFFHQHYEFNTCMYIVTFQTYPCMQEISWDYNSFLKDKTQWLALFSLSYFHKNLAYFWVKFDLPPCR